MEKIIIHSLDTQLIIIISITGTSRFLQNFTNLEVILRDDAQNYTSVPFYSHPEAIRISDRNTSDVVETYLLNYFRQD